MSEINYMRELSEVMFPIIFKMSNRYQRKYPGLIAKLKTGKYKCSSFCRGSYHNFNLITCEDKNLLG